MGHFEPIYGWFILAGLVPLLLHLFMRFRVRRIRWGATWLLDRALKRLGEESKWWYYLLLTSRILAGVALGYAFTRPFLPDRDARADLGDEHQIVLVDTTYSMAYVADGQSSRDHVLSLLAEMTDSWSRGTLYSLYTLADGLQPVVERERFTDAARMQRQLEEIVIQDGGIDLAEAVDGLRQRQGDEPYRVILAADAQARNWSRPPGGGVPDMIWLQPARRQNFNLAITAVDVPGQVALTGDTVQVDVHIACSGEGSARHPVDVELDVSGLGRQRRTDSILPGQTRVASFDVRFETPGQAVLTAALRTHDGLVWDDRMHAAIEVRERLRVGVVHRAGARAFDTAMDYLRQFPDEGGLIFEPASETGLDRYDVVLLDNPSGVSAERMERLAAFVRSGGGLILSLGPDFTVAADAWKHPLWPAAFGAAAEVLPVDGTRYHAIQSQGLQSPPWRALRDRDADGLANVRVYGFWPVEPHPETDTVALLDNGRPWIVAGEHGMGRVVVLASGLSGLWNNLPVRSGFAHFLHRLVADAASGTIPRLNLGRNQEVRTPAGQAAGALLAGPLDGDRVKLSPMTRATRHGREFWTYPGPVAHGGLYAVRLADGDGTVDERFVALYDRREESDILPLSSEVEAEMLERLNGRVATTSDHLRALLQEIAGGMELFAMLAFVLLILLFAESLLSWKVGGSSRRRASNE